MNEVKRARKRPLTAVTMLLAGSLSLSAPSASAEPAKPAAPYSLPWQLRPASAVTVMRSDTSVAFLEDAAGEGGATAVTMLLASYKVTPELSPLIRLGVASNMPPGAARGDAGVVNPMIGAIYGMKLTPDLRLAFFLGLTLPFGMGGGDSPDPAAAAAARSGILARAAMDNAMFAVNDLTVIPGIDLAYIARGLTAQIEATLLQLTRTRGEEAQKDSAKTNLTAGLHVGYFVLPQLSLSAELRYQRWLSTPAAVAADATGTLRDTLTFAAGPRFHIKLPGDVWLRPGLAYSRGLDRPMTTNDYHIAQIDLPLIF